MEGDERTGEIHAPVFRAEKVVDPQLVTALPDRAEDFGKVSEELGDE